MTLRLHDTATRSERKFSPVEPGKASLYLCGATVQAPPHIGHIKHNLRFRQLSVRGKTNAAAEWAFTAAIHNLLKAITSGHLTTQALAALPA